MSGRTKMAALRKGVGERVVQLVVEEKVREQIIDAAKHGLRAKQRADRHVGLLGLVERLTSDAELRAEVNEMARDLRGPGTGWRPSALRAIVCATCSCWRASAAASHLPCARAEP